MAKSHFYDDAEFSYVDYWRRRQYEDAAERMAIKRLLLHRKFDQASDIGGGYGRLTQLISQYTASATLVEPSDKMRLTAKNYLHSEKNITIAAGTAEKTGLTTNSQDLVTMFRVLHHLPNLQTTFDELHRVLKPNGLLLIEFANSTNFKARLKSFFTGKPIMLLPVERRSAQHIRQKTIDFVNHHPDAIMRELSKSGFRVQKQLSVSNFRAPFLKKFVPLQLLLVLEYVSQTLLSGLYFGPSIFILASKFDK